MNQPDTRAGPEPAITVAVVGNAANGVLKLRMEFIRFLIDRGCLVTTLAPRDAAVEQLESVGARFLPWRVSRGGLNPFRELVSIWRLRSVVRQLRPAVVVATTPKGVIYGSIAARAAGVRHIFSIMTGLGYTFAAGGVRRTLLRWCVLVAYRIALAANASVFFQNEDDRRLFVSRNIVSSRRACRVRGSGVDLQRYVVPDRRCEPGVGTTFLMVARLLRDKGVREYSRAAKIVHAALPATRVCLLGPYDENPAGIGPEYLEPYIRAGVLEYWGSTADVRPFLTAADVFVLPSYREGTSRAALEALAMGMPVVTTDAPGCREVVIPGENGYLVPVRDHEALASAMIRLARSPAVVASMGARSRAFAERDYDVDRVNATIWRSITRSLSAPPEPAAGR